MFASELAYHVVPRPEAGKKCKNACAMCKMCTDIFHNVEWFCMFIYIGTCCFLATNMTWRNCFFVWECPIASRWHYHFDGLISILASRNCVISLFSHVFSNRKSKILPKNRQKRDFSSTGRWSTSAVSWCIPWILGSFKRVRLIFCEKNGDF